MTTATLSGVCTRILQYLSAHETHGASSHSSLALRDPVAGTIVGSHYALSHYCAGLYLQAYLRKDDDLKNRANAVFDYICETHQHFVGQYDYHNDFNNFALALLLRLDSTTPNLLPPTTRERSSQMLRGTPDSRHTVVNWLPMRAFNCCLRGELTGKRHFLRKARCLLRSVLSTKCPDGLFEDQLQRGLSANPQYHAFTLAVLRLGHHLGCFDLDPGILHDSICFLVNLIDPDGDFNYFGRGTNQVFGWGPMLFLLRNLHEGTEHLDRCASFLAEHVPVCLRNNGILLDCSIEYQHVMWRSYHYSSVYVSHLFFWLSLTEFVSLPVSTPTHLQYHSDNVRVVSNEDVFASVFAGRTSYIAERGPMLCNLWLRKMGSLFKGPLGPFLDCPPYQPEHIAKSAVVLNYLGPVREGVTRHQVFTQETVFPRSLEVCNRVDSLHLHYVFSRKERDLQFNLPVFAHVGLTDEDVNGIFTLSSNSVRAPLYRIGSVIGPYHELNVYRTKLLSPTGDVHLVVRHV